jgi:hypothetical protein
MGMPKTAEEYSFEYPEGFVLPDELAAKVKEFGMEKGIPPQNIEALLPFQMELQKQSEVMKTEEHIAAQMEMGDKYFGGEGSFDKEAPGLAQYAESQGYDVKTDPAFRNATTYKLLAEIRRMTGEDSTAVRGDNSGTSAQSALDTFLEKNAAALRDPRTPNLQDLNTQFLHLSKIVSDTRKR